MFQRWLVNSGRKTMKNLKLILIRKKNILGTFTKKQWILLFFPNLTEKNQQIQPCVDQFKGWVTHLKKWDWNWSWGNTSISADCINQVVSSHKCPQPREFNKKESQFPIATATSLNKDKKPSFEIYCQQEVRQNKPILSRVVAQGRGTTENWNLKPIMIGSDRAWFKLSCQVGVAP